jgi:hypothetical protein
MSEKIIQVDASTGQVIERDLSDQELADLEALRTEFLTEEL